jgi:hypothetical protein
VGVVLLWLLNRVLGGEWQEKEVGFIMPEENRTSLKAIGEKMQP